MWERERESEGESERASGGGVHLHLATRDSHFIPSIDLSGLSVLDNSFDISSLTSSIKQRGAHLKFAITHPRRVHHPTSILPANKKSRGFCGS